MLYVLAVKEIGASRAAVIAGAAPLVAVTIALTILGEPFEAALVVGAVLIVLGVVALAGERDRPEHLRFIGLVLALASTVFFATRDNIVRWLAEDTTVDPQLAAAATLVSGSAVMAAYLLFLRGRRAPADVLRAFRPFALPGVFWGVSYAAIFEAFYRGRVSIVSPLVATEALFGVLLAAAHHREERADRAARDRGRRAHRLRRCPDRSVPVIVAHLDLDAFYAAVEELEDPSLRAGAAHRRRQPAWTRRRLDRELPRPRVRHPLGDELRRGACDAARTRCSSRPGTRFTASTRGPCGTPSATSSRRSSAPVSTRAISTSARWRPTFSQHAVSRRPCRPPCAARRACRRRSASRPARSWRRWRATGASRPG